MNPQQLRRAALERAYRVARAEYLSEHPDCQIRAPGCTGTATEISHIVGIGRGGAKADKRNFKSACHWCGQWVEHNKEAALELGHHQHGFQKIGEG